MISVSSRTVRRHELGSAGSSRSASSRRKPRRGGIRSGRGCRASRFPRARLRPSPRARLRDCSGRSRTRRSREERRIRATRSRGGRSEAGHRLRTERAPSRGRSPSRRDRGRTRRRRERRRPPRGVRAVPRNARGNVIRQKCTSPEPARELRWSHRVASSASRCRRRSAPVPGKRAAASALSWRIWRYPTAISSRSSYPTAFGRACAARGAARSRASRVHAGRGTPRSPSEGPHVERAAQRHQRSVTGAVAPRGTPALRGPDVRGSDGPWRRRARARGPRPGAGATRRAPRRSPVQPRGIRRRTGSSAPGRSWTTSVLASRSPEAPRQRIDHHQGHADERSTARRRLRVSRRRRSAVPPQRGSPRAGPPLLAERLPLDRTSVPAK